jgi:hypothetical protein
MKVSKEAERFCGSCDSHNCYDYPSKVFCSTRYAEGKDPIVDTLWNCSEFNQVSQECYCVREAKRAKDSAKNQN